MGSPGVGGNWLCEAADRGFKQSVPQPHGIAPLKAQRLAKHPSLVPTAGVRRAQAIVLELPDIEDRPIAMRQMRHHAAPS
jgi:hypothetical protein